MKASKFYFSKESRSDEKIRYTETDMYSIVRTILFMHAFQIAPNESIVEIINTGQVSHCEMAPNGSVVADLSVQTIVELLDSMFGAGFATVVKRVAGKCYTEYSTVWKFYPYISNIKCPSASDYINLYRFVNASTCEYSACERFITTNTSDHKIPLQENKKLLK